MLSRKVNSPSANVYPSAAQRAFLEVHLAKKKNNKVPKRVAGVKLPKALRKSGLAKSLLGTRAGRQLLADALIAAAGAAAAVLVKDKGAEVKKGGGAAVRATGTVGKVVESAAGAVAEVVGNAARNVLPAASDNETGRKKSSRSKQQAQQTH
jgi:hypothetical protein